MKEQGKGEKKSNETHEINQLILDTCPAGILIFEATGPCVMANPAAARIVGASREELLELNYRELESFRRTGILADIEEVLKTGNVLHREVHTTNTFGKEVWFEGTLSSFQQDSRAHVLLMVHDIHEQKRLEQELSRRHAEFQSMFNSITDTIVFADRDRRIVMVNPAFGAMFGYRQEEVLGKTTDMIYADHGQWLKQGAARFHESAGIVEPLYEIQYRRKDGSVFPSETLGVPVRDSNDQIMGFLGVIRDLTERKAAEQERNYLRTQWERSQRLEALGNLAGGIAHDFNNILAVIVGYTDLAIHDSLSHPGIKDDLRQILQAASRARDLIQQILAFGRSAPVERVSMKPQPVIKEALKMLRASIPPTITIRENISPDCGAIDADPTQLHQVLMNLCTNSFHAMEETGGTLVVGLRLADDVPSALLATGNSDQTAFVELSVSDTGCGIDPEMIDSIFDPFFTTKEKGKGSGMGLAIVYNIVTEYGGIVTVESEQGEGTTFHVFLPQSSSGAVAMEIEEDDVPGGSERVLFVDDEPVQAQLGKKTLERLGYQVTELSNSVLALELFEGRPHDFDVVITDQAMPGMTGVELAEKLVRIRADIPVILSTGYTDSAKAEFARARGVRTLVLKPWNTRLIANLIRKTLDEDPGLIH